MRRVRLEFTRAVQTSRGVETARDTLLLSLTDADGRTGYGEAAPWPGFGTEGFAAAFFALEELARVLDGADVEAEAPDHEFDRRLRNTPAAQAALQGALWDLAARRDGVPLSHRLARSIRPDGAGPLGAVPTHALLAGDTPEAVRAAAAVAREEGFGAAKLKLGLGSIEDDVARARAAREALGPDLRLRGDANGAWDEDRALAALERLAPFGFEYVEQPLRADALPALAALRRRSPVRIALDESVATATDVLQAVESGAADVVVLKPAFLGGARRALEIAAHARAAGAWVVYTHAMESAVGAHHALHCAAADGDSSATHGLCTEGLFMADVATPVCARRGIAAIPSAPGIGVSP